MFDDSKKQLNDVTSRDGQVYRIQQKPTWHLCQPPSILLRGPFNRVENHTWGGEGNISHLVLFAFTINLWVHMCNLGPSLSVPSRS